MHHFSKVIKQLRENEEVMLYGNVLDIESEDIAETVQFLEKEYRAESANYPYCPPEFNVEAALWGAKTVYVAAQLLLYRENRISELHTLITSYSGEITSSAILSADLCLRFLPELVKELKVIDPEDLLIELLVKQLEIWNYSAISYSGIDYANCIFTNVHENECLKQMYVNRIIEFKNRKMAQLETFLPLVKSALGIYADTFWSGFSEPNAI